MDPNLEDTGMNHAATEVIRAEHKALGAILTTLLELTEPSRPRPADFKPLRAMLLYIDEFPERLHHVKETQVLFRRLRDASPQARDLLDRLDADHAHGEAGIRALQHELLAYELLGESRRESFVQALQRYAHFYLEHMRTEEREILPLAEQVLGPDDWREIDAAFAGNRDPLTGHAPDEPYVELFRLIALITPAPYGFADRHAA